MKPTISSSALLACGIAATAGLSAHAGDAAVTAQAISNIRDTALNPTDSGYNISDTHTGYPAALNPISKSVNDSHGIGSTSVSAYAQAGIVRARVYCATDYAYLNGSAEGFSSGEAYTWVDDYVTVTSSTLATGTVVNIDFGFLLSGTIDPDASLQARIGIDASMDATMRASSSIDDQLMHLYVPQSPVSNLAGTVQAKVGDVITFRYGVDAIAYLYSDIPDVRSVDADFSTDGYAYMTPQDPAVTLVAASGYAYTKPCPADFNQDGFVDFFDFTDFVNAFETGC